MTTNGAKVIISIIGGVVVAIAYLLASLGTGSELALFVALSAFCGGLVSLNILEKVTEVIKDGT